MKFNLSFLTGLLILTGLQGIGHLQAQNTSSSPYSRFGPGDLLFKGFAHERGMGGSGVANASAVRLNSYNPAALSYDTVMIVDAGFTGRYESFEQAGSKVNQKTGEFSYLSIALPVWRGKGAFAFGILPFSSTGYKITDTQVLDTTNTASVKYLGDGGYNRYFISTGWHLSKNLSAGLNASYLYGTVERLRKVEFSAANYFNTKYTDEVNLSGLYLDFGLHYNLALSEKRALTFGLSYAPSQTVSAKRMQLWENYALSSLGTEVIRDTISYNPDQEGNVTIPAKLTAGAQLAFSDKLLAGLDVSWQDWSNYSSFGSKDSLKNSMRVSGGMQWVPDPKGLGYWNRVQYRAGFSIDQTFLDLRNNQLMDYGVSLGVGLPFREPKGLATRLNIAIEAGQKGTTSEQLVKQSYVRLAVGVTLNEDWFRKRRYD